MSQGSNLFLEEALRSVPRFLSQIDPNPLSPTYGCMDRNYWHFRLLTDFPAAIYQQGALTLALLYTSPLAANPYSGRRRILELSRAAMEWWAHIQRPDGSFDEWFPREHCQVATAFTTWAITSAMTLLSDVDHPWPGRDRVLTALAKAGHWLITHPDRLVANHTAGSALALLALGRLLNHEQFTRAGQRHLEILLELQSPEGWFSEYGGADAGYQSVSIGFLAHLPREQVNAPLRAALDRALAFLAHLIHPDGSAGGAVGSRNTRYVLPHGPTLLSPGFPLAARILPALQAGLARGRMPGPGAVDDRYLTFFFLPSHLQAGLALEGKARPAAWGETASAQDCADATDLLRGDICRHFLEAGLLVVRTPAYHLVVNLKKGGVLSLFSRSGDSARLIHEDAGYFGKLHGRLMTTQWLDPEADAKVEKTLGGSNGHPGVRARLHCPFTLVDTGSNLARLGLPLRLWNHSLGHSGPLSDAFHNWLRRHNIAQATRCGPVLEREIAAGEDEVVIHDRIDITRATPQSLFLCRDLFAVHSPTSRHLLAEETVDTTQSEPARFPHHLDLAGGLESTANRIELELAFHFGAHGPEISLSINQKSITRPGRESGGLP